VTEVQCPALAADVRAEFQARAQVDLSLRSPGGGDLRVVCDGFGALLTWRPRSGGTLERSIPEVVGSSALVDALLIAVADLAGENRLASAERAPKEIQEKTENSHEEGETVTPESRVPLNTSGTDSAVGPPWLVSAAVLLGAGASAHDTASGLAGGRLGVVFGLPSHFHVSLCGDYSVGFGQPGNVGIRAVGGTLLASRWFGSRRSFEVGVGVGLLSLSGSYLTETQSTAFLTGTAHARYALQLGSYRVAFGPEVHVHGQSTMFVVNGTSVYEVPHVTAGIGLDVTARWYGQW
jgi:hypothetical protein